MRSRRNPAHVRERDRGPDGAVAAHAEIPGIVEEDEPGRAIRCCRLAKQGADHRVEAARLVEREGADVIVPLGEDVTSRGQRARSEIGPARDHETGRFSFGMRID